MGRLLSDCAPWAGACGWRALDLAHSQAQSAWLAIFWFAMLCSSGSSPVSFKGSECAFLGATEPAGEAALQSALWLSGPGLGPHSKLPLAATVFSPCGLGLAPLEFVTCLWTAPLGPPTCSTSHILFSICPLKAPPSPSSPREGWGWHSSPLWGTAGWDPRASPGAHLTSSAVAPAQKWLLAACASGTARLPSVSDPPTRLVQALCGRWTRKWAQETRKWAQETRQDRAEARGRSGLLGNGTCPGKWHLNWLPIAAN